MGHAQGPSEIVFFDVETTSPTRHGQAYAILEFAAIFVCPKKLTELHNYSTLVRPADPSLISPSSVRCNSITHEAVADAPTFADIADKVYELLHERIWAGHNILTFDCVRIREAFSEINRPPPEPKATIDSLPLLTRTFGRRAGDMKMASLAAYFGLGQQIHRSLADIRMNLEVIKYCAAVMFLESSFPDVFTVNSGVSPNTPRKSCSRGKSLPKGGSPDMKMESILLSPITDQCQKGKRPRSPITMSSEISLPETEQKMVEKPAGRGLTCRLNRLFWKSSVRTWKRVRRRHGTRIEEPECQETVNTAGQRVVTTEDSGNVDLRCTELDTIVADGVHHQPQMSSPTALFEATSGNIFAVLKPHDIFTSNLTASLVQSYHGTPRIQLLHDNFPFQLSCADLKIRFGIRDPMYHDDAGRPKLDFVVDAPQSLCEVLEACDAIASMLSLDSGSSSDWRPLVFTRKEGFFSYRTVKLKIPITECGNVVRFASKVYKKESSGTVQKLRFNKSDTTELGCLLKPGTPVDAVISLDPFDYRQKAGIKLVAQKLIIHE